MKKKYIFFFFDRSINIADIHAKRNCSYKNWKKLRVGYKAIGKQGNIADVWTMCRECRKIQELR